MLDASALRAWYRDRGSDLVVARGEPSAEIPALVEEYDAEYVPELADVPAERIHGWTDLTDDEHRETTEEYPHPIVDHDEACEAALAIVRTRPRRGPRRVATGERGGSRPGEH